MARKRDYAAEYARRQERAQARGYESEYERRILRNAPPGSERPSGEALRKARGHASRADLIQEVQRPRAEGAVVVPGARDDKGRILELDIAVVDSEGGVSRFTLRGDQLDPDAISELIDYFEDQGIDVEGEHYLEQMGGGMAAAA